MGRLAWNSSSSVQPRLQDSVTPLRGGGTMRSTAYVSVLLLVVAGVGPAAGAQHTATAAASSPHSKNVGGSQSASATGSTTSVPTSATSTPKLDSVSRSHSTASKVVKAPDKANPRPRGASTGSEDCEMRRQQVQNQRAILDALAASVTQLCSAGPSESCNRIQEQHASASQREHEMARELGLNCGAPPRNNNPGKPLSAAANP